MKKNIVFESVNFVNPKEDQNNYIVIEESNFRLYFVFGLMGSASNSLKAVEFTKEYISKNYAFYFSNGYFDFTKLMFDANDYLMSKNIPELITNYCSLCLSQFSHDRFQYSGLGNMRIYLITPKNIQQISENTDMKYLGVNDFYTKEHLINRFDQILICSKEIYSLMENAEKVYFLIFHRKSMITIKNKLLILIKKNKILNATYLLIRLSNTSQKITL